MQRKSVSGKSFQCFLESIEGYIISFNFKADGEVQISIRREEPKQIYKKKKNRKHKVPKRKQRRNKNY